MKLFVTVGTTRFDDLVEQINSKEFLNTAILIGITRITLQHGNSPSFIIRQKDVQLETLSFTDDPHQFIREADIVIGHCGSGTSLDVLRGPICHPKVNEKGPILILVPNETLMDNHQSELAHELEALGCAHVCTVTELPNLLLELFAQKSSKTLSALPEPNKAILNQIARSLLS
jgi:beta-1,4-N-acetylglucosaminyltransferase